MAFNKDQWVSSFEDQLAILRPHLTLRVLTPMGLIAWHRHGVKGEDLIEASKAECNALDLASGGKTRPTKGHRP